MIRVPLQFLPVGNISFSLERSEQKSALKLQEGLGKASPGIAVIVRPAAMRLGPCAGSCSGTKDTLKGGGPIPMRSSRPLLEADRLLQIPSSGF